MKQAIIMAYDAPASAEFDAWMHGPHYDEVLATPGVTGVQRFKITDGPDDRRGYVAIIYTDDLAATLAWRDSPAGQASQKEANDRGLTNRYGQIGEMVFSSMKAE